MADGTQVAAAPASNDAPSAACPLRFDGHTIGLPKTCMFVGRYSESCGGQAIAIFAGNGDTVAVGLAFGAESSTTYFAGEVQSGTEADLVVWQRSLQLMSASTIAGSVNLEDGGELLRVQVASAPFRVNGCQFSEFVGHFVEMVDAPGADEEPEVPGFPGAYQSARAN